MKEFMGKKHTRLTIIPLGGLGEIGKNMMVVRYGDEILLIDAGLAFPDEEMLGIDIVIPDMTYILENRDLVRGIVVTHGHEDHIGALPYLLRNLNIPIYGSKLTLGMATEKLREFGLDKSAALHTVRPRSRINIGTFEVEFFRVNHSTADCLGLAITTPAGVIVHTGDFKFDQTPVDGEVSDYHKLAELGDAGVLVLLSDSTNAERPGFTPSERVVGKTLSELFAATRGRILVTSFASNVPRIQQVINAAAAYGRKVAVVGRSMENVVEVSMRLGYLEDPEDTIVDIEQALRLAPQHVVILTTGSQGEPLSALARIAAGDHRKVEVMPGDTVILAATPVPGNEKLVARTINNLFRRGANVIYEAGSQVHVSGHASQEELKLMLNLVKPRFLIPIHGEYRHLIQHARLAREMGMDPERVLVGENGTEFSFTKDSGKITGRVQSGQVLVDGYGVGDVGNVVLRDRKTLAQDGILIAAVALNKETGMIVGGPELFSRGFVYVKESELLMEEAQAAAEAALEKCTASADWNDIKSTLRDSLSKILFERTGRRPMILPVIVEV